MNAADAKGAGPIAGHFAALLAGVAAAFVTFVEFDPAGQFLPVRDRLLDYFVTIWRAFGFVLLFNGWMLIIAAGLVGPLLSYGVYRLSGRSSLRTPVAVLYGMAAAFLLALLGLYIAAGNPLNKDACRTAECMRQGALYYLPAGALAGLVLGRVAYGRWWSA
jgi:hypothetical protein